MMICDYCEKLLINMEVYGANNGTYLFCSKECKKKWEETELKNKMNYLKEKEVGCE